MPRGRYRCRREVLLGSEPRCWVFPFGCSSAISFASSALICCAGPCWTTKQACATFFPASVRAAVNPMYSLLTSRQAVDLGLPVWNDPESQHLPFKPIQQLLNPIFQKTSICHHRRQGPRHEKHASCCQSLQASPGSCESHCFLNPAHERQAMSNPFNPWARPSRTSTILRYQETHRTLPPRHQPRDHHHDTFPQGPPHFASLVLYQPYGQRARKLTKASRLGLGK